MLKTPEAIAEKPERLTSNGLDETETIPALENGDHLTRVEFERRYTAMPHIKKAELIEGVVYMGSPVRHTFHSAPHGRVMAWLGVYCLGTPGVDIGDNATVRLDQDNEPQPDALLRLEPEHGGQSRVTDDGFLAGPPELIVEIAASTASYDLHEKKRIYRRNGVLEYIAWRIYDNGIDWFRLENEEYIKVEPDANGVIESSVFPGLRLAVSALLENDLARVLVEVQKGLASPEHAAFVARLAAPTPATPPSTSAATPQD